jgi:copper chaperone CopZ
MTTTKFAVNMHCPSCAMLLEGLEDLPGVEEVRADFKQGSVVVTYEEDEVSAEYIVEAIAKEGYVAQPVEA